MGWLVIVGSIPIGVLGITLKDAIEGPFRDLRLIATTLIVMGVVLGIADRLAARDETGGLHRAIKQRKSLTDLSVKDGLLYGVCQAMALVPGVSRSGATISGGLLMGYTRESAARYSFLLAIPAVLASGVYELKDSRPGPCLLGPHRLRHDHRLRRRLRGDRMVHEVHLQQVLHALRHLPHPPGHSPLRPGRSGRPDTTCGGDGGLRPTKGRHAGRQEPRWHQELRWYCAQG